MFKNFNIKLKKDHNDVMIIKKDNIRGILLHRWYARQYLDYHRGFWWWIIFIGVLLIIGLLFIFFTDNILFGIVCILSIFTYYTIHIQNPHILEISITNEGIYIGDDFIKFDEISSFGIINKGDIKELYINIDKHNYKIILLEKESPEYIRNILSTYLKENEHQKESIFRKISRILKF